ncbi:hypothetical protein EDD21DRAFT_355843 [Dissophora ornata]|nr:hypothetical protein EDD21DRAFT_355843 [Dissophora ornata]
MIRVVSKIQVEANSDKARIPNASLWPCLAAAWDDVTVSSIRNSFAHVPTIPKSMQEQLRTTDGDQVDSEEGIKQLKEELSELYPGRGESIKLQKDFGVLVFIKCCQEPRSGQHDVEFPSEVSSSQDSCFVVRTDAPDDDIILG